MNLDRVDNVQDMKINNNVIYAFGDEPQMIEPLFQIGDEVETNEKYREMAEEHNQFRKKHNLNSHLHPEYRRGRVTNIHAEDFSRARIDYETGLVWLLPEVEGRYTDVIVYMDDLPGIEHALNQDYLQKVKR